jgi:hypothetical protein
MKRTFRANPNARSTSNKFVSVANANFEWNRRAPSAIADFLEEFKLLLNMATMFFAGIAVPPCHQTLTAIIDHRPLWAVSLRYLQMALVL